MNPKKVDIHSGDKSIEDAIEFNLFVDGESKAEDQAIIVNIGDLLEFHIPLFDVFDEYMNKLNTLNLGMCGVEDVIEFANKLVEYSQKFKEYIDHSK